MATMNYAERVRHPGGALDPPRDKGHGQWFWILFGLAVLAYFAWRVGWLDRIFAAGTRAGGAVKSIANPQGWV